MSIWMQKLITSSIHFVNFGTPWGGYCKGQQVPRPSWHVNLAKPLPISRHRLNNPSRASLFLHHQTRKDLCHFSAKQGHNWSWRHRLEYETYYAHLDRDNPIHSAWYTTFHAEGVHAPMWVKRDADLTNDWQNIRMTWETWLRLMLWFSIVWKLDTDHD